MRTEPVVYRKTLAWGAVALAALTLNACGGSSSGPPSGDDTATTPPNILFIVVDDLGVDQLHTFGYGGLAAQDSQALAQIAARLGVTPDIHAIAMRLGLDPSTEAVAPTQTPSLDAIAHAGVRFRNTWSMPTCTPTRATVFEGRYPFRTDVLNAVVSVDLANSQVSPFALTTPKLLKEQGYTSALIGKMHLSGSNLNPANHPLGDEAMRALGWDHFEGYLDGGPYPIDTTAGGVATSGTYGCGFVPSLGDDPSNGADSGACYLADGQCSLLSTAAAATPGRACLEQGGIFDPGTTCQSPRPDYLDFDTQNAYYTGEWVINHEDGSTQTLLASDPGARGYRSTQETDRAIHWVEQQSADTPWMLSVGYSAIHTPLQQPPESLLPAGSESTSGYDCTDLTNIRQQRVLTKHMLEALDHEISRLLIGTGVAHQGGDGLEYDPDSNTVVVIVGDNGTYAPSVRWPFDASRAKGFPYQTGVWVPLIVAGPMVEQPDRDVGHMVNTTDLFSLFGELAGIDVRDAVPAARELDAEPMLAYLTEPDSAGIRTTNYTEMGTNLASEVPPPCVIPASNVCVAVFPQQDVCEDQGGIWYGPGSDEAELTSCCAVNTYLEGQGEAVVDILPSSQRAIRNDQFKLVRIERLDCASDQTLATDEFYAIDEATPIPTLDRADDNLLPGPLTPEQEQNYDALAAELAQLLASEIDCPGDGNRDGVVDSRDLDNWAYFNTHNGGRSSWYDFNLDGLTDETDRTIIETNRGLNCAI